MKTIGFILLSIVLLCLSGLLGLYIITNTVLDTNKSAQSMVSFSSIPSQKSLTLAIGENSYQIQLATFATVSSVTYENRENIFNNLITVFATDSTETTPKESSYRVSRDAFSDQIPLKISHLDYAYIDNGIVKNCESESYNIFFDEQKLAEVIKNNENVDNFQVSIESITEYPFDTQLIELCNKYVSQKPLIDKMLYQSLSDPVASQISTLIALKYDGIWFIEDFNTATQLLVTEKLLLDTPASNGEYEVINQTIALLKPYSYGRSFSALETANNIERALNNPELGFQLSFKTVSPDIFSLGLPIVDFTKLAGSGKTRIDLIRNGQGNVAVYFAELGLAEVHNVIIQPGQEFSYLNKLSKQPGTNVTASGRVIGYGYCNSVTTIFRAALETGLPITDRTAHGYYIASYDWGYPLNIVDATMWAGDTNQIDFKFVNNFAYPILMRVSTYQDSLGYQYHTVNMYTNSNAPDRDIQLSDWKKWDEYSPTHFKASFKRTVFESGQMLFADEFFSHYVDV